MNRIYEFGDFRVHPTEQLLLYKGQPVAVTPKVFETLVILLESDGRLIDKNDFIDKLWPGVFVEDVALAQNISHLRKALGDGTNGTSIIQTVPKTWLSVRHAGTKSGRWADGASTSSESAFSGP